MPDVDDELVELAHDFAEREMRPQAAGYDESGEFPWDIVHRAAELGLASYELPEEYGGGGVSSLLTGAPDHRGAGVGRRTDGRLHRRRRASSPVRSSPWETTRRSSGG